MNKKELTHAGWHLDNSYSRLPELFYRKITVNPVRSPKLVIFNEALAETLGLDSKELKSENGMAILAGNRGPEGSVPIAQAYAGHQFGNFTMLGDGRALLIGEQMTPAGKLLDIQLKGSGRTPYSRGGDGRAALRPMLREYLISEAMHGLGIPTTRSLAVVETGEMVRRETPLPGAVMTRVADSHLRVGTFQYAARFGTKEDLKALADYALERHFPYVQDVPNRYLALFQEVIKRQAALIAKWQLAGFIHGVMNTDNMAISGETIDYGPCAFMDNFDPKTVFSSIDVQGRYAYGNQPMIAGWNLARFAESLLPLLHDTPEEAVSMAQEELTKYIEQFQDHWLAGMRRKLGLFNEEAEDAALVEELLNLMHKHDADYTNTFRSLTFNKLQGSELVEAREFKDWHKSWQVRLERQENTPEASHQLMRDSNPAVIPRNHRVEEALIAAEFQGDYTVLHRLLAVLANPYAHSSEQEAYTEPPEPTNGPYQTFCGT
ncbi:YdiU family protein [Planococcus sp. CPCC 101016]|uniref:protein adenylyltransferase SelO n=1 Tax=Planococcus sp. CPCC 101016 TaxID=2599617 RepID=UPI0011B78EE3|nr:YdiU family protein [Planococcus sp. CPCC 101016]TWT05331.1 YdiU family protein [Planococcus sp. CPCC 101016]